jgi:hypothetical protein
MLARHDSVALRGISSADRSPDLCGAKDDDHDGRVAHGPRGEHGLEVLARAAPVLSGSDAQRRTAQAASYTIAAAESEYDA